LATNLLGHRLWVPVPSWEFWNLIFNCHSINSIRSIQQPVDFAHPLNGHPHKNSFSLRKGFWCCLVFVVRLCGLSTEKFINKTFCLTKHKNDKINATQTGGLGWQRGVGMGVVFVGGGCWMSLLAVFHRFVTMFMGSTFY